MSWLFGFTRHDLSRALFLPSRLLWVHVSVYVFFLQDLTTLVANGTISSKPPVTLRLVIPPSQPGSLIG